MVNNDSSAYLVKNEKKFRELLFYLDENNAYYHNVFMDLNIDLNSEILQIFNSLPIITKKDINNNYDMYISKTNERKIQQLTSGSNGEPLRCLKTDYERTGAAVMQWKERKAWDSMVNGNNFINIFGDKKKNFIGDFTNFDMDNMKSCFDKLMVLSPRWLWTSISVVEKYAQAIERGDLVYKNKKIKFIELVGEYVEKNRREYIENIFDCKTINHYGTRETWCIAYECPEGELHVINSLIYVETINNGLILKDNDQIGEIVVTSLYNKVMPIIRYNLEDLVQISSISCKCGKTSQVIKNLKGRKGDIIKGSNGILGDIFFKRIIHTLIWKGMDCIESFRVEQIDKNYFLFYIVKKNNYSSRVSDFIQEEVLRELGVEAKVEFRFIEKMQLSESGKAKVFSCNISTT